MGNVEVQLRALLAHQYHTLVQGVRVPDLVVHVRTLVCQVGNEELAGFDLGKGFDQ